MKKLLAGILIALSLYACKKSSGAMTTTGTQWTLNSTNYQGNAATYDTSSGLGLLVSADAAGNSITVLFFSHPSSGGTYTVTSGSPPGPGSYCALQVETYTPGTSTIYTSTGKAGNMVDVTVSGGKLTASFKNVAVAHNSTAATSSGNVIQ